MSTTITQFVAAGVSKSLSTGIVTAPAAGSVPTADGVGNATWLPNGAGTTLISAGGAESLVNDGTGPVLATKGLTAGTGVTLASTATAITVTNSDPGSAVSLTSAGGTETLVNDGVGPALATKGLTAGTGVTIASTATAVTVSNSDPGSAVSLTSVGGTETLVNDGVGPALATKGLTAGTGVTLASTATEVTVSVNPTALPFVPSAGGQMTGNLDMLGSGIDNTGDLKTINIGTATIGEAKLPYRNLYLYDGGAPGAGLPTGVTKFRQWALQTVANTTTDTSFIAFGPSVSVGSNNIPANTLELGATYSARVAGVMSFNVGGVAMTFRFRIGATIISTLAFIPDGLNGTNNLPYILDFNFVCSATGVTGAGVGSGCLKINALTTLSNISDIVGVIATGASAATIDTTIANTINVSVQHGVALGTFSATARYVLIKRE